MKAITYLSICMLVIAAVLPACTQQEEAVLQSEETPVLRNFTITTSVAAMQAGGNGSASRSLQPMGPEEENPIKSLAIIQFSDDGILRRVNEGTTTADIHHYYHYISLAKEEEGNPGALSLTLPDIPLYAYSSKTYVCFIGNATTDEIDGLLMNGTTRVNWPDFKNKTIDISATYKKSEDEGEDVVGHVNNIYLFGYYEGPLGSGNVSLDNTIAPKMSVVLSRLIARLEIGINLGDGVNIPSGYHIYFQLKNVEELAYLFLDENRSEYEHKHIEQMPTTDRTDNIRNGQGTFYYYVAPHLVRNEKAEENATQLLIWCTKEGKDALNPDDATAIYLCNDPSVIGQSETLTAEGAYWLNRNSIYHVNITLGYKDETATQSRQADASQGVQQADGSYHYQANIVEK